MQGKSHRSMVSRMFAVALLGGWAAAVMAGTEGPTNTYYGQNAGLADLGDDNTFIGRSAGRNATGEHNVAVGALTARLRAGGDYNTFVGSQAGEVGSGSYNVYIGYGAGYNRVGDHELVIDNCYFIGVLCARPLIAGKFDQRLLDIDGVLHVTANRSATAVKSQLHFSVTGEDVGGWMTSAGDNNFFTSSGARYDAIAGGWIQRSADGKAVIAGSGAAGFRVLTSSGTAVGDVSAPVARLHIDYDGAMGVNTAPAAGRAINTSTGAYLSSGGAWVNASSRDLKEDIRELSPKSALQALRGLKPVTYRYKAEAGETHAGFIAEEAPDLVATADRKGISALDVVAVLTKVLQDKESELEEMKSELRALAAEVRRLQKR